MNSIDYYKSLISDEEVIKALVKESKAREGLLKEKARLRPNLTFFQRTVTNLVTSNSRAGTTKKLKYEEEVQAKTLCKSRSKIKTPRTLIKEIVELNKVDYMKNNAETVTVVESDSNKNLSRTECGVSEVLVRDKKRKLVHKTNDKIKCPKSLIKEIVMSNKVNFMQKIECVPLRKCESIDPIEKMEKDDLKKYFVRGKEQNMKSTQNLNKVKQKSIVFNLNINKDRLGESSNGNRQILDGKRNKIVF